MPNKVEQVPITVAGNILSELSEKIPNNIIALNELIKMRTMRFLPVLILYWIRNQKNSLFEIMVLEWIQKESRNCSIYQVVKSIMGKPFLLEIFNV